MRTPLDPPLQITQVFGVKDENAYFGYHSGIDYAVPVGTPVRAPKSGKILSAAHSHTGGMMIVLFDGMYYHRLMHNSSLLVASGDSVNEGSVIAYSGNTGLSSGPHLHWDISTEMMSNLRPSSFDKFISPTKWLESKVDMITKEQEQMCSKMKTGSLPGKDYNYKFTGKPLTQANLDAMLQFWESQPRPSVKVLAKGIYEFK